MQAVTRGHQLFKRWEPYVSFLMALGVFSWLGKQLKVFGQLGWAEATFIGLLAAFVATACLALYRYFRPLPEKEAAAPVSGTAAGAGPALRVWVGSMVPFFDETERGHSSIEIAFINIGQEPVRIGLVTGSVYLKGLTGNGAKRNLRLPTPAIQVLPNEGRPIPFGGVGRLLLSQPIPSEIASEMPDLFMWRPRTYFQFDQLKIKLTSVDGHHEADMPLWESMRLTAGENEVRAVETFSLYKSEAEREAALAVLAAINSMGKANEGVRG